MSQIKQKRPHSVEEPIEQLIELLKLFDYSVGHRIPIWLHTPSSVAKINLIQQTIRRPANSFTILGIKSHSFIQYV